MRNPYTLFVNSEGKFELIDTRDNVDTSRFVARTTSSWKKVVTAGQRRYYSTNHNFHSRGGTYILTYPDNSLAIVNPHKGDYIPPGYTRVSRELGELFGGWDGVRCANRSRLVPINGNTLMNANFVQERLNQFCLYRNRPEKHHLKGWTAFHNANSYYLYARVHTDGIISHNEDNTFMITQTIAKEVLDSATSLTIRLHFADQDPVERVRHNPSYGTSRSVLIGTTPLVRAEGTNDWVYEGDALDVDTPLTIEINGLRALARVEVVND